jgi:hypothetical protein
VEHLILFENFILSTILVMKFKFDVNHKGKKSYPLKSFSFFFFFLFVTANYQAEVQLPPLRRRRLNRRTDVAVLIEDESRPLSSSDKNSARSFKKSYK